MSAAIPDRELKAEVEQLEAEAAAMRGAIEHSISALEYIADELRALGEDGDADMMERQAQENQAALAADAGRKLLERLRRAERALAAVKEIQLASVLGGESSLKGDYNESKL